MKKMKVMALVLAAALACMSLTACGGSKDSGDGTSASGNEEGKGLTVATSPDFPPFESLENNEIVGIEVDIMNLISEDLGMPVKYEQMDFDSVIPGVQTGKFDVGMSGITVTEDRQKNCDFTDPYFLASQAIVVTADSPITCKADLEGKKISVQTGTTAEEYCMDSLKKIEICLLFVVFIGIFNKEEDKLFNLADKWSKNKDRQKPEYRIQKCHTERRHNFTHKWEMHDGICRIEYDGPENHTK